MHDPTSRSSAGMFKSISFNSSSQGVNSAVTVSATTGREAGISADYFIGLMNQESHMLRLVTIGRVEVKSTSQLCCYFNSVFPFPLLSMLPGTLLTRHTTIS
jgi:hypothetical protein